MIIENDLTIEFDYEDRLDYMEELSKEYLPYKVKLSDGISYKQAIDWCKYQLGDSVYSIEYKLNTINNCWDMIYSNIFIFKNKNDAIRFKLVFG